VHIHLSMVDEFENNFEMAMIWQFLLDWHQNFIEIAVKALLLKKNKIQLIVYDMI
jgi:hypothetical protein